jgi:enoyl-[acyl-carrier protein] reductase I
MSAAAAQRRVAVFGVANEDSIAWHVAQGLKRNAYAVHIGYQQRFRSRILPLTRDAAFPIDSWHRCDLTSEEELEEFVRAVGPPLHGIVHSVAFAPPTVFNKRMDDINEQEFAQTMMVSCFSLLSLTRRLRPLLTADASIIAMTYIGSQRVVPNYRLMGVAKAALEATVRELAVELGPSGIRVNAISAGPMRTLSALAVPQLGAMLERYKHIVPLRRCVSGTDIAEAAHFLLSPAARAITGQTIFVDAGFSVMSVPTESAVESTGERLSEASNQ